MASDGSVGRGEKTLDLAPLRPKYTGRHRVFEMEQGCGFIPHGDRDRVKPEYNEIEERVSVDKYTKYSPI